MTNDQLYLAIGVPVALNALMLGVMIAYMNSSIGALGVALNKRIDDLRSDVNTLRVESNQRFESMAALFRTEIKRLEDRLPSPIQRP